MNLLVTGPGRTGTRYTAAMLQAWGLDATHETVIDPAVAMRCRPAEWRDQQIEVSHLAGFRPRAWADRVALQVRHPLKAISSRLAAGTWRLHDDPELRVYRAVVAYWAPWVLTRPSEVSRCVAHLLACTQPEKVDRVWRVEKGVPVGWCAKQVGAAKTRPEGGLPSRTLGHHDGERWDHDRLAEEVTGCEDWPQVKEMYAEWYGGLP